MILPFEMFSLTIIRFRLPEKSINVYETIRFVINIKFKRKH